MRHVMQLYGAHSNGQLDLWLTLTLGADSRDTASKISHTKQSLNNLTLSKLTHLPFPTVRP